MVAEGCDLTGIFSSEANGINNPTTIALDNYKDKATQDLFIGKKVGEVLEFGGLFGSGPVMPVNKFSSSKFISRGGRIPAPLQSLKN